MLTSRLVPCFVAALTLAGCAVESSAEVTDEGTVEASQDALGKAKHHYTPGVSDVTWHPGCGMVREDQPPCLQGLTMTYTKGYIDLTFTHSEKVNNTTHTLDITVDSWSYGTIHPMVAVHPETIALSPENLQMGTKYKVYVRDRMHKVLWQGDIATYLAM